MCLIAYAESKHLILNLPLKRIWEENPHGAGLVSYKKGKIYASKGYQTIDNLTRAIDSLPDKTPVAVHFRFATHGSISPNNCHPFKVNEKTFLMHNGVLSGLGDSGLNGRSDSAHLARILGKLPYKDQNSLLEALSGKFLLANNKNITMHGSFEKYSNVLCSNTYFKIRPVQINYIGKTNNYFWSNAR